ncbi:O-antigen ligase [uncultured Cellulomonas sp.]|uniref:O-antigen ligase family protein n=1 Tax=uncultured Cellulomonas sp. TaxID=189682 RepID=UPI002626669F|nr:O-antigen ligase family protein [uncultured Cellulomonas sp.]
MTVLFPITLVAWYLPDLPGARELGTLVGALTVVAAALAVPRHDRVVTSRVPWPLVLFGVWACASLVWSADRAGSARALLDLVVLLAVGIAVGVRMTVPEVHRAVFSTVRWILVVTAVSLVVAPGWAMVPAEDGAPGWHGPFSHKNDLGAFCAVAVVTVWFGPRRSRWVWMVLALVLLAGSQSSTAVAVVALAAAVVGWQRLAASIREARHRGVFGAVSLVATLGVLVAAVTRFDLFAVALGRSGSLTGRTEIWTAVWRHVVERPIAGYGWGGVWREWSAPTQEIWREVRFPAFYAHNGYLDLALQVGVVGLALFLLALGPAIRTLWRDRADGAALWGLLIILTSLVAAVTESAPFTGRGLLLLVPLVVAVASGPGLLSAPTAEPSTTTPERPALSRSSG